MARTKLTDLPQGLSAVEPGAIQGGGSWDPVVEIASWVQALERLADDAAAADAR